MKSMLSEQLLNTILIYVLTFKNRQQEAERA